MIKIKILLNFLYHNGSLYGFRQSAPNGERKWWICKSRLVWSRFLLRCCRNAHCASYGTVFVFFLRFFCLIFRHSQTQTTGFKGVTRLMFILEMCNNCEMYTFKCMKNTHQYIVCNFLMSDGLYYSIPLRFILFDFLVFFCGVQYLIFSDI